MRIKHHYYCMCK